ncbi:MAG: DUF4124 domain-containing protein [Halofilum sp. (in: g-proteobacteria)]|nr:DUF4124 domain-containing protein [Halofilum sp. (in: g-proteobacteria)]
MMARGIGTRPAYSLRAALWAAVLALVVTPAAAGKSYRWVDEDGNVHYGDRMPADASRSEHAVIDDSGTVREQHRSADEEEAERAQQQRQNAGKDEAQARRDRMLRETFTSEGDLLRMRDRRVEAVDAKIAVVEHQVEQLETQRQSYVDHLASVREAASEDSPAVQSALERLARVDKRLEGRRAVLAELRAQRERIIEQFATDLERFRELKAARGN